MNRDVVHLQDVRDLIQLTYRIQEASPAYVLVFSAALLFQRTRKPLRARLARPWMLGGLFTIILLLAVGLGMLLDFDRMFLVLHLISFTNQFWIWIQPLPYLIRMVPQGFSMELALTTALLALAEAMTLAMVAGGILARQKRAELSISS